MTVADTIFALSSGAGKAGIAVIRMTGPLAFEAAGRMAAPLPAPRRAGVRTIRHAVAGEVLDEGMVLLFPGPSSVTGEDVVEFHVHGGPAVVAAVMASLQSVDGLRLAEAGEFTRRAFRNGRIDLVEAEGLADLLGARTEAQRRQAVFQSLGGASSIYGNWRERLVKVLALVEASVDFIEEDDVAAIAIEKVAVEAADLAADMTAVLQRSRHGEVLRDGVRVGLFGLPNVGKSSLLNVLAQREAAIVSDIPGTTRDVIEVQLDLDGVPVIVSDTAGLRDTSVDPIEQMGMTRSRRVLQDADVVVWVAAADVAGSTVLPGDVTPDLIVWNKTEIAAGPSGTMAMSIRRGDGVAGFLEALRALVREGYGLDEPAVVVRERQAQAIRESIRALNDSIRHRPSDLELVAEDLRRAAAALGRLTGAIGVEDLLSSIFSSFCIGK